MERTLLDVAHKATGRYLRTRRLPDSQHDDVLSDACWGAAQAAASYDPARGVALNTHAYNRVRGAILDGARLRSPVTRHHYSRGVTARQRAAYSLDELAASAWEPTAPGSMEETVDAADLVARILATCTPRERIVLVGSLLYGYPLRDIADELGISENGVCQIRRRAMARLRAQFAGVWQDAA